MALVVYALLPNSLVFLGRFVIPGIEVCLLVALIVANPRRITRQTGWSRAVSIALAVFVIVSNLLSLGLLIAELSNKAPSGENLLLGAMQIWVTNVIGFALLYWELDRGGPAARAQGERDVPDFLFVQMQSPELAPPHWEPAYLDYFYLSFTNSTAFSPTDVMPVTRWAKMLMLLQSAVSLMTVVLVVARAVNILK